MACRFVLVFQLHQMRRVYFQFKRNIAAVQARRNQMGVQQVRINAAVSSPIQNHPHVAIAAVGPEQPLYGIHVDVHARAPRGGASQISMKGVPFAAASANTPPCWAALWFGSNVLVSSWS